MLLSNQSQIRVKSPLELGLNVDVSGIYIMTEDAWINAMPTTGKLQFGVGDAVSGTIIDRKGTLSSSKNPAWQKHILDTFPNPGYRDKALHKIIRETFASQLPNPETGQRSELFETKVDSVLIEQLFKSRDFEPIRLWLTEKIRKCASELNSDHKKRPLVLRKIQCHIIRRILAVLLQKGLSINFVCELAPRIGKTILFLELAKILHQEYGHKAMFIMAYGVGLSVKTSYKNELNKFSEFEYMQFIDASVSNADEQYQTAIATGKMPVVFVSLNPEAEEKYEWINQLDGTFIALLEETDFGSHTDTQVEKVEFLLQNKIVTRFNASGTNIGRLAKAFGKNAIDEIISVPYCMVEQDSSIPNVVTRKFYNMVFDKKINKQLENFDEDVLPNITKILSKPYSQQKFISSLFQDIFGYQPIYGLNISDEAGEEIRHTMLFINITNDAMEKLAEVVEKACPEHKVLILNGEYTNNSEAENLTKEELVRLQNDYYKGRDKLLVMTNMMGTRSYSVPEIQACLFMYEGGSIYPYMQKYSRVLDPSSNFNKKYGHIFDFSFDQNKTRNTLMSVAVEAALLLQQGEVTTYPDAVRTVLNSVNIKDVMSGQWVCADDIIKQFEDNDKLLEVANAHTRITIEDLTSEEIDAFGELASRSTRSKGEKTKIEKIVKIGKTFDTRNSSKKKPLVNPLKRVVEKAIRMINGSASTVIALSNFRGESFLDCINIINESEEMSNEFLDLYGITPETIIRLAPRLELSTLDVIVQLSKYNPSQKHIESNALAILKDEPALWKEIFLNRKMRRFISSNSCKSILVVAGGYGTEIDVLVEMFGVDIIEKITYNDKYSFMCNNIKHKYPKIKTIKGDFISMKFSQKFDVIVGNPPYREGDRIDNANKLWPQFVRMSSQLLEKNGYLALIHPNSWVTPGADIGKGKNGFNIIRDFFSVAQLVYANVDSDFIKRTYFSDVGSTFSWYILQNVAYAIPTQFHSADGDFDVDLRTITELPVNLTPASLDIMRLVFAHPPFPFEDQNHEVKSDKKNGKKDSSDNETEEFKFRNYHTPAKGGTFKFSKEQHSRAGDNKVMISLSGKYKAVPDRGTMGYTGMCIVLFTDKVENAATVLNSKLYRFIVQNTKFSGFNPRATVLRLPKLDLNQTWTDDRVYRHFGVDTIPGAIELIESVLND